MMVTGVRAGAVSVRAVGPFDLGRLARLHRSCFDEAWSRSDLAHLLAMPGAFGLVARLYEGGLAGLDGLRGVGFAICRVAVDESELLTIGVSPTYRRRGAASALLQASMERCERMGARSMFLEVAIDNVGAQGLYEEHGFERVGLRPDYYQRPNGLRASAYTMRSLLPRQIGANAEAGEERRARAFG
jgi:[ribosomal protein S18]-alanine N-acetyltransferase